MPSMISLITAVVVGVVGFVFWWWEPSHDGSEAESEADGSEAESEADESPFTIRRGGTPPYYRRHQPREIRNRGDGRGREMRKKA